VYLDKRNQDRVIFFKKHKGYSFVWVSQHRMVVRTLHTASASVAANMVQQLRERESRWFMQCNSCCTAPGCWPCTHLHSQLQRQLYALLLHVLLELPQHVPADTRRRWHHNSTACDSVACTRHIAKLSHEHNLGLMIVRSMNAKLLPERAAAYWPRVLEAVGAIHKQQQHSRSLRAPAQVPRPSLASDSLAGLDVIEHALQLGRELVATLLLQLGQHAALSVCRHNHIK